MALVLADVGADKILAKYFKSTDAADNDLRFRLYTNSATPADTDTAGTYNEAAGGGYAVITLTTGAWSIASANDPSDATAAQQTWTFTGSLTGSATIYGYFVTDGDGTLIFAERLGTSFTPANNGDQLKLTPKFQLSKGTPA